MRKSVLAVAASASVFAMVVAGATGLGTVTSDDVNVTTSGSVNVTTNLCSDAIAVSYTLSGTGTSAVITDVILTADVVASSTCDGLAVDVTLSDGAGTPYEVSGSGTFSEVAGTIKASIDLDADYTVGTKPLASTSIVVNP